MQRSEADTDLITLSPSRTRLDVVWSACGSFSLSYARLDDESIRVVSIIVYISIIRYLLVNCNTNRRAEIKRIKKNDTNANSTCRLSREIESESHRGEMCSLTTRKIIASLGTVARSPESTASKRNNRQKWKDQVSESIFFFRFAASHSKCTTDGWTSLK